MNDELNKSPPATHTPWKFKHNQRTLAAIDENIRY